MNADDPSPPAEVQASNAAESREEFAFPASFSQRRLWVLHEIDPSAAYNIARSGAFELRGPLDPAALERSLAEIVNRHESLRTRFASEDGEPVQVISAALPLAIEHVDLSGLPPAERAPEARRRAVKESGRSFDLARGPLFRVCLIRLDANHHMLLMTLHHAVSDGWSIGILARELTALYSAFVAGQPSPLPELALQFADFSVWQQERLAGGELEPQIDFWRNHLAGELTALELASDRRRPAAPTNEGGTLNLSWPPELSQSVDAFSRSAHVTPFMTLLAAFQALLVRYTGVDDVIVGSPIAGRTRAEVEDIIGFFVNTLPIRSDLSGNPTFREAIGRVRDSCLATFDNQDVPFEKLVELAQPERDLSRSPLFGIVFALQNAPATPLELTGIEATPLEYDFHTARFDLEIHLRNEDGCIGGEIVFSRDLFDEDTIARLSDHYRRLLERLIAAPDTRIEDVALLSDVERKRLLEGTNDTATAYPRDLCVHTLFERAAERTPSATAVCYGHDRVTYAELNARANQLAHHLISLGVGPDVPVGLCVERSVAMVVGMLGILKAGGAYLPVDPEQPSERLELMLRDANAPVLLTQDSLRASLPVNGGEILSLDGDSERFAKASAANPPTRANASHLAYLIFTSGSTGVPKGIRVPHRAINRLVCETNYVDLDSNARIGQASNSSFDAATFEIWGALLHGGQLIGIPKEVLLSPRDLAATLRENEISALFLTTALFNQVARELPGAFSSLGYLLVGGEACDPACFAAVLSAAPPQRLLHVYGPTETTTFATWHPVEAVESDATTIPIGRPISNTRVYVLDTAGNPVPQGVVGELCIGGDGVAAGYLNRPELDAEKFRPDPFVAGGAHLYRSGDRVRMRADASIEFVGRVDDQVKIRGFRIEPGEVETVLARHPGVNSISVIAREDVPGERRLVAYVVAEDAALEGLRTFAADHLPGYMVPAAFVALSELPISSTGKIDRRALPEPGANDLTVVGEITPPRDPMERAIAGIWSILLQRERIGVHDNFFELGGHSLLATQVISRIRSLLGAEVPLRSLFGSPTVADLARHAADHGAMRTRAEHLATGFTAGPLEAPAAAFAALERLMEEDPGADAALLPIPVRTTTDSAPLSTSQQRLWFLHQMEPNAAAYHFSYAIHLLGSLDLDALTASLRDVATRHETLRTRFVNEGHGPVQIVDPVPDDLVPVEEVRDLEEARRRALIEGQRPYDLEQGPLFRPRVLRLSEREHVLLLDLHHIVFDGWSMGILIGELGELYRAHCNRQVSQLAELPIQYRDYSVWQHERLQVDEMARQLAYWNQQLQELTTVELPTDRSRPRIQTFRGAKVEFEIREETHSALQRLSGSEGSTLFMTLLAAYALLLHRYTGSTDIPIGSPIANRSRSEIEELIGFFVNMLVLRVDFDRDLSFRELLRRVRDMCLDAYNHQDLPFEKLVETLRPERDMSRTPLFQTSFALQHRDADFHLSGLEVSRLGPAEPTSRFDLECNLWQEADSLQGQFVYNRDLFDASRMQRVATHFTTLLESIAKGADERCSTLTLMDPAERDALARFNDTKIDFPSNVRVHELFEARTRGNPDALAVSDGARQFTYGELDEGANRLARQLRDYGVGRDVVAAVFLERSVDVVLAALAIMKAGGAFLQLDPNHPRDRIHFMLEDAAVGVVVTESKWRETLAGTAATALCLDDSGAEAEGSESSHSANGTSSDLAYLIYTSGSTGQPKAVAVPHRGLSNLIHWHNRRFALTPDDRISQIAALAFDASVWEIWPGLIAGASVHFAPTDALATPDDLRDWLVAEGIHVSFLPTPLAELMFSSNWPAATALRTVLVGGDRLHRAPPAQLPFEVVNNYGPTESSVVATSGPIATDAHSAAPPSIGRPIDNTRLHILDAALQPVPIGVPGELFIGGEGLARGYWKRPDLTAEHFISDPFSNAPGARLYRSGDLVRWRENGEVDFLGRTDNQVKLRGFRIELGEVEAALERHESIGRSIATVREAGTRGKQLLAYVVARDGNTCEPAELRNYLLDRLPQYMIPSAIVVLDEIPLTRNGKVDHNALPAPRDDGTEDPESHPFLTPMQAELAEIWREHLGIERVRVNDNFFDLGGHSLLAMQVVRELEARHGIKLNPRELVLQTLGQLAAFFEQRIDSAAQTAEPRRSLWHRALGAARGLVRGGKEPH